MNLLLRQFHDFYDKIYTNKLGYQFHDFYDKIYTNKLGYQRNKYEDSRSNEMTFRVICERSQLNVVVTFKRAKLGRERLTSGKFHKKFYD